MSEKKKGTPLDPIIKVRKREIQKNKIKIKEKADNNKKSSDVTNSAVTERDIKHTDELIMA